MSRIIAIRTYLTLAAIGFLPAFTNADTITVCWDGSGDHLTIQAGIDASDTYALPPDVADLDGDGDTEEPTPLDLDGRLRFADRVGTPDTGFPPWGVPVVDMGVYEYQCTGDLDGDGEIELADLAVLLADYGTAEGASYNDGDLDQDGDVDLSDLSALLAVYGTTCE